MQTRVSRQVRRGRLQGPLEVGTEPALTLADQSNKLRWQRLQVRSVEAGSWEREGRDCGAQVGGQARAGVQAEGTRASA